MNIDNYKNLFASALERFVYTLRIRGESTERDPFVILTFQLYTYVFEFYFRSGDTIVIQENQEVHIGRLKYSVEHVFMNESNPSYPPFDLYSFRCCSSGLSGYIEGHLTDVYFVNSGIYSHEENLQIMIRQMETSDMLHVDFLTDSPKFPKANDEISLEESFSIEIQEYNSQSPSKRKRIEEENYGVNSPN
jgi:hypothetical protein